MPNAAHVSETRHLDAEGITALAADAPPRPGSTVMLETCDAKRQYMTTRDVLREMLALYGKRMTRAIFRSKPWWPSS